MQMRYKRRTRKQSDEMGENRSPGQGGRRQTLQCVFIRHTAGTDQQSTKHSRVNRYSHVANVDYVTDSEDGRHLLIVDQTSILAVYLN